MFGYFGRFQTDEGGASSVETMVLAALVTALTLALLTQLRAGATSAAVAMTAAAEQRLDETGEP